MDKVEALRSSSLLKALSDHELQALLGIVKERTFAPGETFIRAGDRDALAMFVILEGKVEVRRGRTQLSVLGPGQHIGEMALLGPPGTARSADVVAVEPTRALQLASWDLFTFLDGNPKVSKAIINELARRLALADERLASILAGEA
jgi:CRP-like cAMP-binding protein